MKKAISLTTSAGQSITILSTDIAIVEPFESNNKVVYKDPQNDVRTAIVTESLDYIKNQAECLFEVEDNVYLSVHHTDFVGGNASGATVSYKGKSYTSADSKSDVVGRFNQASHAPAALTDSATIDITGSKHTLTSDEAAITFTISSPSDDITLELTLNATSATHTFPATALCVSEGTASGDNTLSLSGVSGDKYIIGIKRVGVNYYVASKNFGQ